MTSRSVPLLLVVGTNGVTVSILLASTYHWPLAPNLIPGILSLIPISLKPVLFVSGPSLPLTPFCKPALKLRPSSDSELDSTGAGFCAWLHAAGKWDLSFPDSSGRVDSYRGVEALALCHLSAGLHSGCDWEPGHCRQPYQNGFLPPHSHVLLVSAGHVLYLQHGASGAGASAGTSADHALSCLSYPDILFPLPGTLGVLPAHSHVL